MVFRGLIVTLSSHCNLVFYYAANFARRAKSSRNKFDICSIGTTFFSRKRREVGAFFVLTGMVEILVEIIKQKNIIFYID